MHAQANDARVQSTRRGDNHVDDGSVDEGTRVVVEMDLLITGPVAQFGRGMMQDGSTNLMRQFAESLAQEIRGVPSEGGHDSVMSGGAPSSPSTAPGSRSGSARPPTCSTSEWRAARLCSRVPFPSLPGSAC